MGTDKDFVRRVKEATDLVALVGQSVKLQKQGNAWVGKCPFHSEKTPSFQVVGERGFYNCFGCHKTGDAINWTMEQEGMTFGEALEHLATQAGIEIPTQRKRSVVEVDLEARLRGALEQAQAYFVRKLQDHAVGMAYLTGPRALTAPFLAEAGLGVALDEWEALVTYLKGQGVSSEVLEQAGLAGRSQRGTQIDFMRDRITIPIMDVRGRLIGFGGRAFGDVKPKYLNTRDTVLFSKGTVLYGLHRAKGHLRDGALVVEGYFDVLQLHQQGVQQAVAPLGTALTEAHLTMLGRYTKRLTLCFDGDTAGVNAAEKTLRLALPMGFEVRLLLLPHGEDPDTWCLKVGSSAFQEMIRNAPDWTSFVLTRALDGKDSRRIGDRMAVLQEVLEFLVYLPDTMETRPFLSSLALEIGVPLTEVTRAIKERKDKLAATPPPVPQAVVKVPIPPLAAPVAAGKRSTAGNAQSDADGDVPPLPPPPSEPCGLPMEDDQTVAASPSRHLLAEIGDLMRSLLVLAHEEDARQRFLTVPVSWWEGLGGASLFQAVLDAEGDESRLPGAAVYPLRQIMGAWAGKAQAGKDLERCLLLLEEGYLDAELVRLKREINDPATMSKPDFKAALWRLSEMMAQRRTALRKKKRVLNAASLGS